MHGACVEINMVSEPIEHELELSSVKHSARCIHLEEPLKFYLSTYFSWFKGYQARVGQHEENMVLEQGK